MPRDIRSRRRRLRRGSLGGDWRALAPMALAVVSVHVLGLPLLALVTSGDHTGKTGVLTLGLGVTAYTLGLRHAFDADHIAAIDNTTRKLIADGSGW